MSEMVVTIKVSDIVRLFRAHPGEDSEALVSLGSGAEELLWDSLPRNVQEKLTRERDAWFRSK